MVKRSLILIAAFAAIAVPTIGSAAQASSMGNIVQVAAGDKQLSTLVSLVKKAGLVGALSGSTKLTVFAPTNAAFAAVPKATLAKLAANKAMLVKVLEYHVVAGELPAAKVEKMMSAKTLEGASLTFKVKGMSVYVNNAKVITPNVMASNGVVHIINKVLLPPSM
jgi:uncharacterized surface protein with fasciclin (FAS1) repeats